MSTSLKKDETYNLYPTGPGDQPAGEGFRIIAYGLRWEPVNGERKGLAGRAERKLREVQGLTDPADWDGGAIFLTDGDPKKYIGFGNMEPFKDEDTPEERTSAQHSGDSVRGDSDGDDEAVTLILPNIPQRYDQILLTGGAFKKGSLVTAVRDVKATVYDGSDNSKLGEYEPSLLRQYNMIAVACLTRRDANGFSAWDLNIVNQGYDCAQGDIASMLRGAMRLSLPSVR